MRDKQNDVWGKRKREERREGKKISAGVFTLHIQSEHIVKLINILKSNNKVGNREKSGRNI